MLPHLASLTDSEQFNVQPFPDLWDLCRSYSSLLSGTMASADFSRIITWSRRSPLVRAFSFLRSLRHLPYQIFVFVGHCNDVLAYPIDIASYTVPVRQYRILQSGFLHCPPHGEPACHLLMVRSVTSAHKGLPPSGKTLVVCTLFKIYLYFSILSRAYNKCALLLMQGTHTVYKTFGGKC